jgi:2-polyprenyl-3-methyl-5-hydroxy-6-metoxy-1,4-benzoquinol methylase
MSNLSTCELCGSKQVELIAYGNHSGGINLHFAKHAAAKVFLPIVGRLTKILDKFEYTNTFSPFYKIRRCSDCGYGKYTKHITEQELNYYYKNYYWNNITLIQPHLDKFPDERALSQYRFVKSYLPKSKMKILDVGAGKATTTRYVREKHKFPVKIDVIEPGNNYRKIHKKEKVCVVQKYFSSKIKEKYDYVHMSHYLEHSLDLNLTMMSLKKVIRKCGLLFIEVPNCDEEYFLSNSRDIPHIQFFTKQSLTLVAQNYDLEVLRMNKYKGGIRGIFRNT